MSLQERQNGKHEGIVRQSHSVSHSLELPTENANEDGPSLIYIINRNEWERREDEWCKGHMMTEITSSP